MEINEVSVFQECQDAFLFQEDILAERKGIDEKNRVWGLSKDYCNALSLDENVSYCLSVLKSQDNLCPEQEFSGNRIVVDIAEQKLYGFQNCQLILESDVITGKNSTPTPIGEFAIYLSRQKHWMQGQWYVEKAYYFLGGYAIHDAGWRQGKNWLKERRSWAGSHGCVNMPDETMNFIWEAYGKGDIVETYAQLPESLQSEIDQQKKIREDILTVKSL